MSRRPPSPVSARRAGAGAPARGSAGAVESESGRRGRAGGRQAGDTRGVRAGTSPRTGAPRAGTGPRRRPAPATSESRPARLARLISIRALVLGIVLLAGFTLLFPTVRAYLGQQAELGLLAAQVTTAEQDEESLRHELDRWQDPAYVAAQARERLGYVMPGETSYRVIDPEVVVEEPVVDGTAESTAGPTVPVGGGLTPWYTTIWESVQVAGAAEVAGVTDVAGSTEVVEGSGE